MDSSGRDIYDPNDPESVKRFKEQIAKLIDKGAADRLIEDEGYDRAIEILFQAAKNPVKLLQFEFEMPWVEATNEDIESFGRYLQEKINKMLGLPSNEGIHYIKFREGKPPRIAIPEDED